MSIKTRVQDSSHWILNSPEALVILMLMATSMASIFFSLLTTVMFFAKSWFLFILFGFFSFSSIKQFIKILRMVKATNIKDALGGITANEFVWHKDKHGRKIEDGNNGYENNESSDQYDEERNGKIGPEIRNVYRQPK